MDFADKLTKLISDRGVKQTALERMTGIDQRSISNFTLRKQAPYLEQAVKLARALDVPVGYLADPTIDTPDQAILSDDEKTALKFYREMRRTRDAVEILMELADLAASSRGPARPVQGDGRAGKTYDPGTLEEIDPRQAKTPPHKRSAN